MNSTTKREILLEILLLPLLFMSGLIMKIQLFKSQI